MKLLRETEDKNTGERQKVQVSSEYLLSAQVQPAGSQEH